MAIITVTSTSDNGVGSLRQALDNAKAGDRIQFSKTLANKKIKLTSGQLVVDQSITIDGKNAPRLTISGNNASRVFQLEKNIKTTLSNLKIADGKVEGPGGGIFSRQGSTLTLINSKVENNTSEYGGGFFLGHLSKATIINSEFTGNDGTLTTKKAGFSAGAISTESRSELIIKGTDFRNNKGSNGGAIYAYSTVKFEIEDIQLSHFAGNMQGIREPNTFRQ